VAEVLVQNKMEKILICVAIIVAAHHCSAAGGGSGSVAGAEEVDFGGADKGTKLTLGKPFILECGIKSEDEIKVEWEKNGSVMVADERVKPLSNGTLLVTEAENTDVGNYKCRNTANIEENGREFYVYTLFISKMAKSRTVIENEKLNLTCEVTGNPLPIVTWDKDGKPLPAEVQLVTVDRENVAVNSTILIDEVNTASHGLYTCTIDFHIDQANMTSIIRVKGLYAALWPFLGIVLEVFLLCCVIFFFERRRSNAEYEESDTDTGKNGQ